MAARHLRNPFIRRILGPSLLGLMRGGFAYPSTYGLGQSLPIDCSYSRLRHSITSLQRYRNINLLSIDYAFRPCLRIRLTPGGITFPGKPWAYGDADSHCINRYSIWHIHLLPLHPPLRENFNADSNALLPTHTSPTASV